MHDAARPMRGGLARLILPAILLAGCAHSSGDGAKPDREDGKPSATAATAGRSRATAESGGTLGGAGSACELPVTFDIAEGWKAEAVDAAPPSGGSGGSGRDDLAGELADALLRQGPVTAACEVDAKPAGNIGFLRVWTGKRSDADAGSVLRAFVAAEGDVSEEKYSTFETGGLSGTEVRYLYAGKGLDESKEECALAVTTRHGPVVLHLGGMDDEEHRRMLPAYELAKGTLRPA